MQRHCYCWGVRLVAETPAEEELLKTLATSLKKEPDRSYDDGMVDLETWDGKLTLTLGR
jgi:hypothetical protein